VRFDETLNESDERLEELDDLDESLVSRSGS
jgi:hypothetical protein